VPPASDDGRSAAFITRQPGVAHDMSIDRREAGSGSGLTVQRVGVAKPEGVAQQADPGALNQNTSAGNRPANAEPGRPIEQPGARHVEPLQAFTSRDSASAPNATEPKQAITPATPTEDRASIPGLRPTTSNESWDGAAPHGRQPEPQQPVARPLAADLQAPGLTMMTSGSNELLPAGPASASPTAAVATAATRRALSEDTTSQIVQAIRLQVTRGGGEATIRLEPRHFGEVSITIRVEQGQVNARLQVESPVVREYLQTHQNLLRESLADQQLTLGKFEVAEPPADSRHGERRSPEERGFAGDRQPQRRRQPAPDTPFEPFEVVA
jgi:flagellar hook-length control protein FliK